MKSRTQLIALIAIVTTFLQEIVLADDPEYKPVMVAEVFRHGARTPTMNMFKESWVNEQGLGNLTSNGMRMH